LTLRGNKVKIPEEMDIIGFDDPVWAPLTEPALTTVSQPGYSMGTLACQTLLREIKGVGHSKIPSEDIILRPRLIIREPSGKRITENFDVKMAFSEDNK